MMENSLARALLSPTTSMGSRGQPQTELALLINLLSLFLSRSVKEGSQQWPAHTKRCKPPQQTTLTLLVKSVLSDQSRLLLKWTPRYLYVLTLSMSSPWMFTGAILEGFRWKSSTISLVLLAFTCRWFCSHHSTNECKVIILYGFITMSEYYQSMHSYLS